MKFSIITPVKNLEHSISETIESVINQQGNFEIEYLILDGGSSDNTLKICNGYKNQIDNLERNIFCKSIILNVISESDKGMYEALAKGLKMVTGNIISYINADDFYLPNAFSCVNEIFSNNEKIKWLTGMPLRYNENGHLINFRIPWQYNSGLLAKGFYGTILPFVQQESVFWRNNLNKFIEYDQLKKYRFAGDYYLWHSFAINDVKLFVADTFLAGNRLRKGQLSENKSLYFREFDTIKSPYTIFDLLKVSLHWIIENLTGRIFKRRVSKNRISYKNGFWSVK